MIRRLFINEAYNQALKSDMNFNHGAVLIYRGKIIGRGYNTYYNNPNYKKKPTLHAEVHAIQDALKKISAECLKHCELVIIRINNHGECLNSKPCLHCEEYIKNCFIKKVYYSN
jgi:tRNA(Arg) A34 adenosine deaminase TadA